LQQTACFSPYFDFIEMVHCRKLYEKRKTNNPFAVKKNLRQKEQNFSGGEAPFHTAAKNSLSQTSLQFFLICLTTVALLYSCDPSRRLAAPNSVKIVPVDSGWAGNSVNTAVFRKNSLVSFGDTQFIAFYNPAGFVELGKRHLGETKWLLRQTLYKGNVADAHNIISVMVDGEGYLHMAWDHHNNPLHYVKSVRPRSLELTSPLPMTGKNEQKVSYPEFYRTREGNLLFFYRDGGSGNGNLLINSYNTKNQQWTTLQTNLIDGEGQRNAYWQAFLDESGTLHLSWVWRESPDVASNHDLCYARSKDGGATWEKSTGERYTLPITQATAEMAMAIPQKSELINQTSMCADAQGHPYIATYWRDSGTTVPQYHLVYKNGDRWQVQNLNLRTTAFSLSGAGTKRIPIARPQIVAWQTDNRFAAAIVFRDEERKSLVSAAVNNDLQSNQWRVVDLTATPVGSWEPTYDTELWKSRKQLHLFVQRVEQKDAEGQTTLPPQLISVVEWNPVNK
jgi:hypothetical protein